MEDEQESLYMPQGLKNRREFFEGYGKEEFHITILSGIIAAILGICICIINSRLLVVGVLIFLVIPTTTVMAVVKNNCNISVVDQLAFMIEHGREQKEYDYIYLDEWKIK